MKQDERTNRREIAVHVKDVNGFWAKLLHEAERENEDLRLSSAVFEQRAGELAARLTAKDVEVVQVKARLRDEEARRAAYQEVHGEAVRLVRSASLARSSPVSDTVAVDAPRATWERLASLVGRPHDEVPAAPGVSASFVWEVFKVAQVWDAAGTPAGRAASLVALTDLFERERTRRAVDESASER